MPTGPRSAATTVVDLVLGRAPTLGPAQLLCLDGPGGSGKTTLAAAVEQLVPGTVVVHMDDLYDGWSGLRAGADQLGPLLRALAGGGPGRYRRFDWPTSSYKETVVVEPAPLVVVEGVGSGVRSVSDLATTLVWVWAPAPLRLERGLVRDGADQREQWLAWLAAEDELFATEGTRARADVLVDGTGATAPRVVT